MYKLSKTSIKKLETCDIRLRGIVYELLETFDITVLCGTRTEAEQNELYKKGRSKVKWPDSKHNNNPSLAIDMAPYPVDWAEGDNPRHNTKALGRFYYMAGKVTQICREKGIFIRWGGDWDRDNDFFDQTFDDLPHFELDSLI